MIIRIVHLKPDVSVIKVDVSVIIRTVRNGADISVIIRTVH